MVELKKLKKYRVSDETLFEALRNTLSGLIFTRKDESGFYIKSPDIDIIQDLINSKQLIEIK